MQEPGTGNSSQLIFSLISAEIGLESVLEPGKKIVYSEI